MAKKAGQMPAEAALLESERRFRTIFDSVNDAIIILDIDSSEILDVNNTMCAMFGCTHEEALGFKIEELSSDEPPYTRQDGLAWIKKAAEGEPQIVEWRAKGKGGRLFWVEVNMRRATISGRDQLLVVVRDISERKQTEEAIRKEQQLTRTILETVAVPMLISRLSDSKVLYANPALAQVGKTTANQIIGQTTTEYYADPEDRKTIVDALRRQGFINGFEARLRRGEGEVYWAYISSRLLTYQGEACVVTSFIDISERKRIEEEIKEEQQRTRMILENVTVPMIISRLADSEILYANPASAQVARISFDKVIGSRTVDYFADPADRDRFVEILQQQGHVSDFEAQLRRDDGELYWALLSARPIQYRNETCVLSSFIEITVRKQAEEKFNQLANLHQTILDTVTAGLIFIKNRQTQWVNKAITKMFGYEYAELIGQDARIFYENEEMYKKVGNEGYAQLAEGKTFYTELQGKRKDGSLFWCNLSSRAVNPQDLSEGSIWIVQDITEHKQAEAQLERNLRETRTRFEISQALTGKDTEDDVLDVLIQHAGFYPRAHVSILTFDRTGSELAAILRRDAPFASGIPTFIPIGQRFPASLYTALDFFSADRPFVSEDVLADERVDPATREIIRRAGMSSLTIVPLTVGKEWLGLIIVAARTAGYFDEEKQHLFQTLAEQGAVALRAARLRETIHASQQRLSLVVEQSPLAIIEWNLKREVVSWNPAATRIFGFKREEALGRQPDGFLIPQTMKEQLDRFVQNLFTNKVDHRIVENVLTRDGPSVVCEWFSFLLLGPDGKAVGGVSLVQDITERKRAEEEKQRLEVQLLHAQKMESVGRLAGGVAHDFNNMLSVILGYTELMKPKLSDNIPIQKYLEEIEAAGLHSRDITRQLLAFSRKQIVTPMSVDLNDLIASTQQTLARLIGEDIDLRFHPGKDLWKIRIDPSQIDQILINLAVNSRDAMANGGRLMIETANFSFDADHCRKHLELTPGHYVLLQISDSGIGMNKETMAHIFEPFFTTKAIGKGTGLGLATVYGIVKQNDGQIELYSELGFGTTFKIYFPRFTGEDETTEERVETWITAGIGTVLLVEDDDMVRTMTTEMLQKIGYTVLVAKVPSDALSLAAKKETPFDLLITDVVMPEMNGTELGKKIREIRPNIRVLFMSGYTSDVIVHRGVLEDGVQFIQKPFSLKDLAEKVQSAIGER